MRSDRYDKDNMFGIFVIKMKSKIKAKEKAKEITKYWEINMMKIDPRAIVSVILFSYLLAISIIVYFAIFIFQSISKNTKNIYLIISIRSHSRK